MPNTAQSAHPSVNHPDVAYGRTGVLIVNLGTPDRADTGALRRYLREFLSDRRVIELRPLFWQPILSLFILPFRPAKSAKAYQAIWNKQRDESPLRTITRAQGEALSAALKDKGIMLDWAMRYGQPSIGEKLQALANAGCDRILVFALYPQYSATTTASVYDETFRTLMKMRRQPALRTAPSYHDDPAYIDALAASVKRHCKTEGWEPQTLIASFHGLPKENLDKGDPYHCHCQKTARLLREALGYDEQRLPIAFQSRFGPKEWLQPYLDEMLASLPGKGQKDVMVISPGFAADCVETLEEISIEARNTFLQAGGTRFSMVPCLNDDTAHITLLHDLIQRELSGWVA